MNNFTQKLFIGIILMLSSVSLNAQEDIIEKTFGRLDPHIAGSTSTYYMYSNESEVMYRLTIYTPPTYTLDTTNYPLLVLTDGFYALNMASSIFDLMAVFNSIEEAVIVGIDYPETDHVRLQRNRVRDMFPVAVDGWEPSGKADSFVNFIQNQLLPFLNNNFRINGDKCFYGHSAGGVLASYMLIKYPELFNRYIIGSPAYWWANAAIISALDEKEELNLNQTTHIYTFMGSSEGEKSIAMWREFNKGILIKGGDLLTLDNKLYEKEGHMGSIVKGLPDALRKFYSKE